MEAVKFVKVENPEEGIKLLLDETGSWLDELCEKYENVEWQGGHDEANFLTSFKDYYEITKSSKVLDLATKFFLAWRNSEEMDFEIKDIHHDTEHYSIFLKWYYDISKDDLAKDILIRYAEFIMENFNEKFGSNSSECVRLIKCVLNAYEVTEDRKYYEWANEKLQAYFSHLDNDIIYLNEIEKYIADGLVNTMFNDYKTTGLKYKETIKKIINPLMFELDNFYANVAGYFILKYIKKYSWNFELSNSVYGMILEQLDNINFGDLSDYEMKYGNELYFHSQTGMNFITWGKLGNRKKMKYTAIYKIEEKSKAWFDHYPSVGALMLGHYISKDDKYLNNALSIALTKLKLFRINKMDDGRTSACSANTISTVFRGHGRSDGIGDISCILSDTGVRNIISKEFQKLGE